MATNSGLSTWASIAEIISGAAVVVTLIFLILGLRENAELTRASMYDRTIDSMNQFRTLLVTDIDAARLWQSHVDEEVDSLDGLDTLRSRQLVSLIFGVYEKAYYAREYDVLGPEEWERFEFQICRQYDRARRSQILSEVLELTMTPTFTEYMVDQCVD